MWPAAEHIRFPAQLQSGLDQCACEHSQYGRGGGETDEATTDSVMTFHLRHAYSENCCEKQSVSGLQYFSLMTIRVSLFAQHDGTTQNLFRKLVLF